MLALAGAVALSGAVVYPSERDRICTPGHSASLRLPYEDYVRTRDQAFARAGITVNRQCHRGTPANSCYILDHIVPLELEGANALENLQVQPCWEWDGDRCLRGD